MRRFDLQSSRLTQGLFAVAVMFVCLVISVFFVHKLKIIFFLLALPWLGYEWSLIKKHQPLLLAYDSKNTWYIEDQLGYLQKIDILPSTVVTAWCVLLDLRLSSSACRSVSIFSDQFADKDHFRQLRVALRER